MATVLYHDFVKVACKASTLPCAQASAPFEVNLPFEIRDALEVAFEELFGQFVRPLPSPTLLAAADAVVVASSVSVCGLCVA